MYLKLAADTKRERGAGVLAETKSLEITVKGSHTFTLNRWFTPCAVVPLQRVQKM